MKHVEALGGWEGNAACAGLGFAMFFPKLGESGAAARKVCAECPVRGECGRFAKRTGQVGGIWGGVAIVQRQRGKKTQWRQNAATKL